MFLDLHSQMKILVHFKLLSVSGVYFVGLLWKCDLLALAIIFHDKFISTIRKSKARDLRYDNVV